MIESNGLVLSKEICNWKNYGTDPYTLITLYGFGLELSHRNIMGKLTFQLKQRLFLIPSFTFTRCFPT